jgi:hypothetical protein
MSELLKKYESIDQSKLNEATIKILNRVKSITADFTADDEKNNKIAEQVLNEVMKKNPDSVKIVKRTPKAKPAPKKAHKAMHTAKGTHKTTSTAPTKTSNNNIMSVAKEIQKSGESWKEAMERAKVVLKERREQGVQKQKTELEKLYNLVKTKKELQGFANSDIRRDAKRDAKPRGARFVSKEGSTSNAYGTFPNKIGRKYWETRDRHADRLAPNYPKDMPLLANGGTMWTKEKVENEITHYKNLLKNIDKYPDYNKKNVEKIIAEYEEKLAKNEFANGGSVSNERMYNFLQDDLAQLEEAIKSGDMEEVNRFFTYWLGSSGHLKSLETKTNERMYNFLKDDLEKLMVAVENNDTEEVERFFSYWGQHLESLKMANGGSLPFMTDPNFGNFQNTGSFEDGGLNESKEINSFIKKLKDNSVVKEVSSEYGVSEEKIIKRLMPYVKVLKYNDGSIKEISIDFFDKFIDKKVKEKMTFDKFELGGAFMMTDLAGHTGGSDGLGNSMPLSGVSGTYYTGLVGETGAMSSGELFMDGGAMAQNQQVINDASQSYVNYYLGEGASQGIYAKGGAIKNQYQGRTPEDIWDSFTDMQRSNFLEDHKDLIKSSFESHPKDYLSDGDLISQWRLRYKELNYFVKLRFDDHVRYGQYASGGSLGKALYVEWSSYFTSNKYDEEKMMSVLEKIGAKNIRLENDRGWFNQPEVVVFNGDKNKSQDALNEAFDTDYIRVSEKDWRTKKMADGGFTPDVSDGTQFMSGVYANGGGIRSQEELNKIISEKDEKVKGLTPKQIAEMWNKNSFGVKEGISKPITVEEAKSPIMKMYLRNLLIENELTEDEYNEYFAKGGSVDDSIIDELFSGYASAVLFTETDSDSGEPLDSEYSISDFDKETVTSTKKMLAEFYSKNKEAIEESELDLDTIGNDVWYTRSGQGAGFFDHSLDSEVEEKLIKGAKALGEYPSVETYDGKISIRGGRTFAKGGFVGTVEFNAGDIVWQKDEKRYAFVMNNYGDPINGSDGEIRLDTSGNTMIFTYDPKTYENTGYNLVKLGEKGDTGKFTPEVLAEMKEQGKKYLDYAKSNKGSQQKEQIAYTEKVVRRTLDGEFDSMTGAKATASSKLKKYIDNEDINYVSLMIKGSRRIVKGSDVLNGANLLKDGGDLTNIAFYVPKRDVISVTLKNGKTITPVNGYWVKKDYQPISGSGGNNVDESFKIGDYVKKTEKQGSIVYGTEGFIYEIDKDFSEIKLEDDYGNKNPKSFKLKGFRKLKSKSKNANVSSNAPTSIVKKDSNKLVAPKGYVFVNSGSHRATQQINRGDAKYVSLYSFGGANTSAGTTIMFMTEKDFEKVKDIKGVSPAKNSLPAKSQWFSRHEDKNLDKVFLDIEQKESFGYADGGEVKDKDGFNLYGKLDNTIKKDFWVWEYKKPSDVIEDRSDSEDYEDGTEKAVVDYCIARMQRGYIHAFHIQGKNGDDFNFVSKTWQDAWDKYDNDDYDDIDDEEDDNVSSFGIPFDDDSYAKGGELQGKFLAEIKVPYNYESVVKDEFEFTEFLSKTLTKKWFGNGAWVVQIVKPLFEKDYSQRIVVEIEIPVGVTQGGGLDKFDVGEFISKTLTKKWFGNGIWGVDIVSSYADGGDMKNVGIQITKYFDRKKGKWIMLNDYVKTIPYSIYTDEASFTSGITGILERDGYPVLASEWKFQVVEPQYADGGNVKSFRENERVRVRVKPNEFAEGRIVRFDEKSRSYVVSLKGKYESEFFGAEKIEKFADGGSFEDNEGFMRADNEFNYRYPEKEVYIETLDEPIDLTSTVTIKSNEVIISPIDENIDLSDDKRVRANMGYTPKNRNPESFAKINPRAFEFIEELPTPMSNTHKND